MLQFKRCGQKWVFWEHSPKMFWVLGPQLQMKMSQIWPEQAVHPGSWVGEPIWKTRLVTTNISVNFWFFLFLSENFKTHRRPRSWWRERLLEKKSFARLPSLLLDQLGGGGGCELVCQWFWYFSYYCLCFSISWVAEDANWFVCGFDTFHNIVSASLSARWNGGLYHLVCWLIDWLSLYSMVVFEFMLDWLSKQESPPPHGKCHFKFPYYLTLPS